MNKQDEFFWTIETPNGCIVMDDEGKMWRGGSSSIVFIPLWRDKAEAMKMRKQVQRLWKNKPYAERWYNVVKARVKEAKL